MLYAGAAIHEGPLYFTLCSIDYFALVYSYGHRKFLQCIAHTYIP